MKKIFALALLLVASGCAPGLAHLPRPYVMPQVGIILTVQNNCAPLLDIESPTHGVLFQGLPFSAPVTLPISSVAFSGRSREVMVMVRGYTKEGVYLGMDDETFRVNTRRGTTSEIWEIDDLEFARGDGGCLLGETERHSLLEMFTGWVDKLTV